MSMPRTSLRSQLVQQVLEDYSSAQGALLQAMLMDLDSDTDSEPDGESGSATGSGSSLSSVSSITSSLSSMSVNSDQSLGSLDSLDSRSSTCVDVEVLQLLLAKTAATLEEIECARVLNCPPPYPRSSQLSFLDNHRINRPDEFRRLLCLCPDTFDTILTRIYDHPIFQNNSNNPQLDPAIQFAVFLNHLGHYGNRSGPSDVADWTGFSVGMIENCTKWSMIAVLSLHDEALRWPSDDEYRLSAEWTEAYTCPEWRGGVLTADGTTFPLFERPGLHGDTWFDRKSRYSMNGQVHVSIIYT